MNSKLELDGVYMTYDLTKILTDIYVKCEQGFIVGLLGRNGSGKSTLLKIAFGSITPTSKSIRINDVTQLKSFTQKISYLPQHHLIPNTISIRSALKLFKIEEHRLLDVFPEAEAVMQLRPPEISGGILRMIEVLLILNTPATFILLDEPFSGIMPVHIDTLKNYMKTMTSRKGIIITDHLYRHVKEIADVMYVLANGKNHLIKNDEQLVSLGYVSAD